MKADVALPLPPPRYEDSFIFGENHSYSVYLRGNGEAVVNFKAQISGDGTDNTRSLMYEFPDNQDVRDLVVFQQIYQPNNTCYPYSYDRPVPLQKPNSIEKSPVPMYTPTPSLYKVTPVPSQTEAVESEKLRIMPVPEEQCYPDYSKSSFAYVKADHELEGNTLSITLPYSTFSSEAATFFLSYRTSDFINQNFLGAYTYEFKTLKTQSTITSIQIGISTEQEYVLKGAIGTVSYYNQGFTSMLKSPRFSRGEEVRSYQIDDFVNSIGYGAVNKYTNNLASMESYTVKGAYASNMFQLYGGEIFITLFTILITFLIAVIIIRKLYKHFKKTDTSSSVRTMHISEMQKNIGVSLGISFITSTFAAIHTFILFALFTYFLPGFTYNYQFSSLIALMLVVFSFCIYVGLLLVPPFIVGIKRGILWGVITFISSIFWLIVYFFVGFIFFFIFFSTGDGLLRKY